MMFEHIEGKDKGKIILYALSTCQWCRMTRDLLSSSGVKYDYVYVDLLKGKDRELAISEVKGLNPSISFPTVVIGDKVIVGFKEKEIRGAIGA
ncbi:MAG: glutaredoxin family protein [Methanotrichaceae archaeon]